MTQKLHTARTAPAAIAAVLALTATPLAAQEAAPTIVLPEAAPAAAPAQPTIVLPTTAPEPAPSAVSSPVVQEVPAAEAPAAAPAATTAAAPSARTAAAPQPAPRAAAPVPVAAAPLPAAPLNEVPAAPPADVAPIAAAPVEAPVEPAAVAANDGAEANTGLIAGGAVIGLGLLGLLAFRRRKHGPTEPTNEIPIVRKPRVEAEPVAAAPQTVEPVAATPIRSDVPRRPAAATAAYGSGALILPNRVPDSFEERDSLLRRMVAAQPDRANPFRSPKARFRRARLIMQSLGQDFRDREPNIDLSDYPQQWPEVARRKYAAAA